MTVGETRGATPVPADTNWMAVIALAFGVASIVITEYLPAGMLTPMARGLSISEGMAGQTVTATAVLAVVTSLLISVVTASFDRRKVLLGLSAIVVLSNVLVALAPNFTVLLLGRALAGISLGGFWSMAAAVTTRLVPAAAVPRALAVVFGGSAFAGIIAAPLGSFLSGYMTWRSVFLISAVVSLLASLSQAATLPSLKPIGETRLGTILDVLRIPEFSAGMCAVLFVFAGYFAAYTYLQPFLEQTTGISGSARSAVLLGFGIAGFVGTSLAGAMIGYGLRRMLALLPLLYAACGAALVLYGASPPLTVVVVCVWGFFAPPIGVAWSAWVTGKAPENAETASGLYVATIQLAAAMGAMAGGLAFDHHRSAGVFTLSSTSWMLSALIVLALIRTGAKVGTAPTVTRSRRRASPCPRW